MKLDIREEKLDESFIGGSSKYKPYSVGRTRRLKKLGNPFFGGEPKDGEHWDMERKLGTAWVIFTRETSEIDKLLELPDPLKAIDAIWDEDMHYRDQEHIYDWILKEAGLTEAAQTEAIEEKRGK